jgi:hypothetical protein
MVGGITSSVHRLTLRMRDGTTRRVVLKRYTDPDWDDDVRALARNEAGALTGAEASRVPAPRLLGVSVDGADTDGVPSLLMTRAAGHVWLPTTNLEPWIRQMAALLPSVHAGRADVWTRRTRDLDALSVPSAARRPDLWRSAQRAIDGEPPTGDRVSIHGDYQHFNILWSRGRLTAVVDWSSAKISAPDRDVGHCRLNLAVLYSADLAERFRAAYETEAGRRLDPWWDVHQLLAYDDSWRDFIPVQVAGRAPVDLAGMTDRVEELLAHALARL